MLVGGGAAEPEGGIVEAERREARPRHGALCTPPALVIFCGGLGTVISTMATVESDFSIVKYVKYSSKYSLHDYSLQGLMAMRDVGEVARTARCHVPFGITQRHLCSRPCVKLCA
jgi:hypothetical protein